MYVCMYVLWVGHEGSEVPTSLVKMYQLASTSSQNCQVVLLSDAV